MAMRQIEHSELWLDALSASDLVLLLAKLRNRLWVDLLEKDVSQDQEPLVNRRC